MTVVSMVTALILNREIVARGFWRAVFFFPVLLSPVVVGLIWRWILQRQGLLNFIIYEFGAEPHNWLTDRFWAFAATITVSVWAHMGFYTLILLAGLQAIPRDLYEAAEMDGTRPARLFWRITLPLLMPNLLVVIVLALIRAVQIFDEAYVLTGGGPGTSTLYLTQYIYEVGFASLLRNPGLAAAASILMGLVLVVLTLIQLRIGRRGERKEARE
jgi:alpha-1,4-digalacturonate transport system permease protein